MKAQYPPVAADVRQGLLAFGMWGRLGWRETKRRYRRTTIGPFWSTLSLAIFVFVLGVVWSQLWKQDPRVYIPFLTSGMIVWLAFSSIANEGSATFTTNGALITQLPISFTLLACANVWRNLIAFAHNLIILAAVYVYSGVPLSWNMLLIVPALLLFALNGVWITMLLAIATARFRDIQQLTASILQVAMFVTPIFWSPSQLPANYHGFVDYNLLYQYIQLLRAPLMGQAPSAWTWGSVLFATVLGWSLVFLVYARFRRRIAYWL